MNAERSEHQFERIDDFRARSLGFFTTYADLVARQAKVMAAGGRNLVVRTRASGPWLLSLHRA
ncbi:MAG: hypothetical protein L0Z48_04405 [candidate division Zixibacteria bacterium]|nr:hypothetical protein [candidate division Zixibacteria bacterium]MCI0595769.1 hypothetical protein [candidate division Zixibacteria bacterium]